VAGPQIAFPIDDAVRAALGRFPRIAERLPLGDALGSPRQIVRLLGSTHCSHVEALLRYLDDSLPRAGSIGRRVLSQTDPFELRQSLAEFSLLVHLQRQAGVQATPAVLPRAAGGHDIDAVVDGQRARIEVYAPVDVFAAQLLEEGIRSILRYLPVDASYRVHAALRTNEPGNVAWTYDVGGDSEVRVWLASLQSQAIAWLGASRPAKALRISGPGPALHLQARLEAHAPSGRERVVSVSTPTRSTDARLLFEVGTAAETVRFSWGRKLRGKMKRRQCGPPAAGHMRLLAVDFALADTGWPEFIAWPRIAARIDDAVRLLAEDLGPPLAYDAVLPCRLALEPSFGIPVVLDEARTADVRRLIAGAGLDRHIPERDQDAVADIAALLAEEGGA